MQRIVIIGAGGLGREVVDVVESVNAATPTFDLLGVIDDGEPDLGLLEERGVAFLGGINRLAYLNAHFVIAIGAGPTRRRIAATAEGVASPSAPLIHPSATFGHGVRIGAGSIICSHVSVTTNIQIGSHVILNLNSTVGHDVVLDDFVTVMPGATVSGGVVLGEGSMLGTNATIIQGVQVGSDVTIGAGAAVVRNLDNGVTAVGVPARARSRLD